MSKKKVDKLAKRVKIFRDKRFFVGLMFVFFVITIIAPTVISQSGGGSGYGYGYGYSFPFSFSGSGGIVFHSPKDKEKKVDGKEAEARDVVRMAHLNKLGSAIHDYFSKSGKYPAGITSNYKEICNTNIPFVDCTGLVDLSMLNLDFMPVDPQGYYKNRNGTGYLVSRGSIYLKAPHAETRSIEINIDEKFEARERLDSLIEKTEELFLLLEERFKKGELPDSVKIPTGEPYLKEYIAYGARNNEGEVRKLQSFLNKHMGESLLVSGFYDKNTFEAVKRFQIKYASEVLHPWGITEPTGFVYLTTQRKINALYYPDRYFPMPTNLIPYSVAVSYDVTFNSTLDTDTKVVDEEELEEAEIDEDEEYLVYEEVEEDDTTVKESNLFLWVIVVLSFIGFVAILSYLFMFNNKKVKRKRKST